jgi:hypothetical protein
MSHAFPDSENSMKSVHTRHRFGQDVNGFCLISPQLKRYKTYAYLLRSRISQYPELEASLAETCIGEVDEGGTVTLREAAVVGGDGVGIISPAVPDRRASPTTNRYSYRAAIYSGTAGGTGLNRDSGGDIG